jgi:hypothetical protein
MTIHSHLVGRQFGDCVPAHQRVTIRCLDGFEVEVEWASSGPEVRTVAQRLLGPERVLRSEFAYVQGKAIKHVLTDGEQLLIGFTDGHELAVRWKDEQPDAAAVNVKVGIFGVDTFGAAT